MKYVVITSFTPRCYETYAKNFVDSFKKHWPEKVSLYLYLHEGLRIKGAHCFDLDQLEPSASFLKRHKRNREVQGRKPSKQWLARERAEGYSFKYDAYKFGRKVFALADAARRLDRDTKLMWFDADVVTLTKVTMDNVAQYLPDDVPISHLENVGDLTELSFVGYNLACDETHEFLNALEQRYASDTFMQYQYWDDGHQWEYLMAEMKPRVQVLGWKKAHPFELSVLGEHMVHMRGNQKYQRNHVRRVLRQAGLSSEHD